MAPETEDQCVVCGQDLRPGDSVVAVFECKHFRHADCSSLPDCPKSGDGMYRCPFDGQYLDLRKWQDGQPRRFKRGLDRFRRLRLGSKASCHYRNMAWICKHIHGKVDEYEKFIRQAAESKDPDVSALLDFAQLHEEGIDGYEDVEKAQLLKTEAKAIAKELKTSNDNLLRNVNPEPCPEEEVPDDEESRGEDPSHTIHEVGSVEVVNQQPNPRGRVETSDNSSTEENTHADAENSSSTGATLDTSAVTTLKSTPTENENRNSAESDQPDAAEVGLPTSERTKLAQLKEQGQDQIGARLPISNPPFVEETSPLHFTGAQEYQNGAPVPRPEQPTVFVPSSNGSSSQKSTSGNESVTVQSQKRIHWAGSSSSAPVEVFGSQFASETFSRLSLNLADSNMYASSLEAGYKVVCGFKLQTFVWTPNGPVNGVVLLLHGLHVHTRFDWLGLHGNEVGSLVGELLNHGLAVYAYDAPGHGRRVEKPHASLDSLEVLRDVAIEMTRTFLPASVDPSRRILIGKGLGAAVGIMVARENEGLFHGMCLISPTVGHSDDKFGVSGKLLTRAERSRLAKLMPNNMRVPLKLPLPADPVLRKKMRDDPLVHTGGLRAGMGKAFAQFFRIVRQVQIPYSHVAVFIGSEDNVTSPARMQNFYDHIASGDKTMYKYDNLRHYLLHEHGAEKVRNDIVSWICTQLAL